MRLPILFIFLLIFLAGCDARPLKAGEALDQNKMLKTQSDIEFVAGELCDRDIVLLGESGFHGDGRTTSFKVDLVQELVKNCDFNAILVESSFYDSLAIEMKIRRGETVTASMISSAMGWIRNQDVEFKPLIPFVFENVSSNRIVLGGLDDQLGGRGSFYSLDQMFVELTRFLPEREGEFCKELFRQRVYSDFSKNSPYTPKKRSELRQCLKEIKAEIRVDLGVTQRESLDYLEMVANIDRSLMRDFIDSEKYVPARDYSMFLNMKWLIEQAPANSKFIIWSTNDHVAKDARTIASYANGKNLGTYIKEEFGDKSFALGFTAVSGSYRYTFGVTKPIPLSPQNSLETISTSSTISDVTYINAEQLARYEKLPGALFYHEYQSNDWKTIFDGIVVFRSEYPAKRLDHN